MRIASRWFAALSVGVSLVWGQEATGQDDLRQGHQLAAMFCGNCHLAAPDQPYEPILNPPAPSFESIAQRKGIDAGSLQRFLATTHRGLDKPNGMPNPNLADYQVKQVIAYILSLRR
jgi:mono/diheme cytochrome c family protein